MVSRSKVIGATAALLTAFAGWVYAGPYLAFNGLAKAAEAGDAIGLGDYVDFPALKESLKGSLSAELNRSLGEKSDNPFAGLAMLISGAMVNAAVEQMVTPESMAKMMKNAEVARPPSARTERSSAPAASASDAPVVTRGYRGWDRFEVRAVNPTGGTSIAWTMRREGLLTWRLKHVDINLGK